MSDARLLAAERAFRIGPVSARTAASGTRAKPTRRQCRSGQTNRCETGLVIELIPVVAGFLLTTVLGGLLGFFFRRRTWAHQHRVQTQER